MTKTIILSERAKDEAIREMTNCLDYLECGETKPAWACYGSAMVWEEIFEDATGSALYEASEFYNSLREKAIESYEEA